ncbi:MAG: carboxypeptidase-like regulatory domain-containing protein, partial [Sediminibacterium sp.]
MKLKTRVLGCIFSLFFIANSQTVSAQQYNYKGKVADHQSEEPLPFVAVSYVKDKTGVITDSAGNFILLKSVFGVDDTLKIQSVGYTTLYIPLVKINKEELGIIHLFVEASKQEVVVKSKYNRSLWFWRKIMSNKPKNNPAELVNYGYELYNKLEVDLNNVDKDKLSKNSLIKPLEFIFDYIDTSETHQAFLPVYLTETISDYYYQNVPRKTLEVIKKTRTNGIENESIIK